MAVPSRCQHLSVYRQRPAVAMDRSEKFFSLPVPATVTHDFAVDLAAHEALQSIGKILRIAGFGQQSIHAIADDLRMPRLGC